MTELNRSSYRRVSRLVGGVGLASLALVVLARLLVRRELPRPVRGRVLHSPRLTAPPGSDGHLGATESEYDWAHAGRS